MVSMATIHCLPWLYVPFTSSAYEGKSSLYFDPSGIIQKNDRAAHGIPILFNIDELHQWVEEIINRDYFIYLLLAVCL